MDFDTAVKLNIYRSIAETTRAPASADVARALDSAVEDVEAAFQRLHQRRLLVPEPGDPSRIRMAPPFSGVATAFPVKVRDKVLLAVTWYENRLTVESRRPGPDEMVEIFARVGLEGPFWDPKADQW